MRRGTNRSRGNAMSLSELQRRVATIVLSLPEASGFALAGGAALILHGLVNRETRDLDCFGPSVEAVDELAPAAVAALRDAGFEVSSEQANAGFVRLRVSSCDGESLVDLGFDPATLPLMLTDLGAVRALADLAGDKLLALFSRAAPRDFVDVAGLLSRLSRDELVELAAAKDRGFDPLVLADAFGVLPTIRPDRFDLDEPGYEAMRRVFEDWRADLLHRRGELEGRLIVGIDSYGCSARAVGQKPPNDDGHLGSPTPASWPLAWPRPGTTTRLCAPSNGTFRLGVGPGSTARYGARRVRFAWRWI